MNAQGALCSWLSVQTVEKGRQYLFRRTFTDHREIADAYVTVASNGPFRLFINGRVVFTSYFPDNGKGYTLDVKAFMHNDSNTVAVWYAPDIEEPTDETDVCTPMFALSISGKDVSGNRFSWVTDSSWLCAPSNALSTSEGENEDALAYIPGWNMGSLPFPVKWKHAVETDVLWQGMPSLAFSHGRSDSDISVLKPSSFDNFDDGKTVSYNFNKPFWGTFRLTVRNAKAGERIWAGGSEYVCKGTLDEQFVGRFVLKGIRKLVVTGDETFRKSHVVKVEGIATAVAVPQVPVRHTIPFRIFL